MSGKTDDKINEIEHSQREILKQLQELFVTVFAIQSLLQERGLFLNADVERRASTIGKAFSVSLEKRLADHTLKEESERLEELRRLLESYEGPKQ